MITLLVQDAELVTIGRPLTGWTDLSLVGRHLAPGSGQFVIPARPDVVDRLGVPGARIVAVRDGQVQMAGPIDQQPYEWEAGSPDKGGHGLLTITFSEDEARMAARTVYPDPTRTWALQNTVSRYATLGPAETAMRNLVDRNAGPGALLSRRIPRLALGAVAGVGSSVTSSFRFQTLGDALRTLALEGGGLGYRLRQDPATRQLLFEVFQPQDLTARVRFSRGIGNLRAVKATPVAPVATVALVAGAGEGTARTFVEVTDPGAQPGYGRLETYVDQGQGDVDEGQDPAEVATVAGQEELAAKAEQITLTAVTVDTPRTRFGQHFGLGDVVTVEYLPGVEVAEVVRGYQINADPETGEVVTVVIGSQESTRDPGWLRVGRDLYRRLGRQERR